MSFFSRFSAKIGIKYNVSRPLSHKRRVISPKLEEIELFKKQYEDDNSWAKSAVGKQIVKQFLQDIPKELISASSMNEFIERRTSFPTGVSYEDVQIARRVLSSLLTFPLTLSNSINKIFPYGFIKPELNVLVIGARAESSLPYQWWKELLFQLSAHQSPDLINKESYVRHRVNIRFTGPHLHPNPSIMQSKRSASIGFESDPHFQFSTNLSHFADLQMIHHLSNPTPQTTSDTLFFHHHKQLMELLLHTDLFVVYHPGFGSKQNKQTWSETIQYLLQTHKPVLCTAHSLIDYEQDIEAVNGWIEAEDYQELSGKAVDMIIPPQSNPFASQRIRVHQYLPQILPEQTSFGTDELEIVSSNQYVYAFQAK